MSDSFIHRAYSGFWPGIVDSGDPSTYPDNSYPFKASPRYLARWWWDMVSIDAALSFTWTRHLVDADGSGNSTTYDIPATSYSVTKRLTVVPDSLVTAPKLRAFQANFVDDDGVEVDCLYGTTTGTDSPLPDFAFAQAETIVNGGTTTTTTDHFSGAPALVFQMMGAILMGPDGHYYPQFLAQVAAAGSGDYGIPTQLLFGSAKPYSPSTGTPSAEVGTGTLKAAGGDPDFTFPLFGFSGTYVPGPGSVGTITGTETLTGSMTLTPNYR